MRTSLAFSIVFSILVSLILAACGGDGGTVDGDGGPVVDSAPPPTNECRAGAMSSTDDYQPLDVGNIWQYEVTEIGTGNPPYIKQQEATETLIPPGETEPVTVQVTTKSTGQTVSWFRRVNNAVVRLQQEDYDPQGLLERTTVYEPYKLRMDEDPALLVDGMSFQELYTTIVYDPQGVELQRTDVTEAWVVVSTDTPCVTTWGMELSCVRLHRERLVGGVSVKDYYFARGYGKVREEGGQNEVLSDCLLQ